MTKFTKKQSISELRESDVIDDVFVVKIKKGVSEYVKGYRFNLLLSDNSGKTLDYVFWGDQDEEKVRTLFNSNSADSVVKIQGKVSSYNGKLQLATNAPNTIQVLKEDQYVKVDFVKPPKKNIEESYAIFKKYIDNVENKQIKQLLKNIFENSKIESKFKIYPAAFEIHHNWICGLLDHIVEMLKICDTLIEIYPNLDGDLLISGVLLHDIGKLEELEVTSRIKSSLGQLTGYIVMGSALVLKEIEKIDGFNEALKQKIIHLIVSRHGKLEYGSPKEPMFPEAIALNYVDELSSMLTEIEGFVQDAKSETEDEFIYNKRHGRNIYLK